MDRHGVDRIARAVVSGKRGLGRRLDALADRAAAMISSRLEAHGVKGSSARNRPRSRFASRAIDPALLELVLSRVDKHLGFAAFLSRGTNAKPHRARSR
jgi:hypothetical protein